jgi:hypothetical protein
MKTEAFLNLIHDNPQSTVLVEHINPKKIVRVDVGEYGSFDIEEGETYPDVGISGEEKERRKRRKDLKLQLSSAGADAVHQVYTISRINEQDDQDLEVKDVQKQQRNRRSPGS